MIDLEPESEEDEDTIIERRRQLRQAIVQKYQQSAPTTPQLPSSPAPPSEVDSETAENTVEAELEEEGRRLEKEGGEEMSELRKEEDPTEVKKREEELKQKKTDLSALRAAVRNGDMFSEEDHLFKEVQLVSSVFSSKLTQLG